MVKSGGTNPKHRSTKNRAEEAQFLDWRMVRRSRRQSKADDKVAGCHLPAYSDEGKAAIQRRRMRQIAGVPENEL
jgi:hypothetical protein